MTTSIYISSDNSIESKSSASETEESPVSREAIIAVMSSLFIASPFLIETSPYPFSP